MHNYGPFQPQQYTKCVALTLNCFHVLRHVHVPCRELYRRVMQDLWDKAEKKSDANLNVDRSWVLS